MSDVAGFTLFIFLFVLMAFIGILPIVGKWKVYGKLGLPGWYSIIPVYADYKLCERVHRGDEGKTFTMAYLIVLICSWAFCWGDTVGWVLFSWVNTLDWVLGLAQLVMTIIVLNDLSRAFGKETGYTIGLVILGFVFWTMLGFGASEPVCLDDESE